MRFSRSNPFRKAQARLTTGIDMPQFPIDQVRTRTDAALAMLKGDTKIRIFGCDHAFDVSQLEAPNTAALPLLCTGMIPPTLVEYALKKGADGVFITGCRTGDCFYHNGNIWLDKRFAGACKPVLRRRAERERIAVSRAADIDGAKLRKDVADFQQAIAALKSVGPSAAADMPAKGIGHG